MSIFSTLFGGSPAPAPAAQPQPQPGNLNPAAAQPDNANPTVPAGTVEASKSPMDTYSTLWQPGEAPAPQEALINADPKQIAEAARKTDFGKMITPEQLAAISQGGEAAGAAFMQAMNAVAQGVYAQSAFASTKIVEQAVAKAREQFNNDIPAHVKKLQVSESLRQANPALAHPAASPILGALEAQMTTKFPNASAAEITSMATQYLENFATMLNAPADAAKAAAAQKSSKDTDWSNYA